MRRDEPLFDLSWSAWAIPRTYLVVLVAGLLGLFLLATDVHGAAASHTVAASSRSLPASSTPAALPTRTRGAP